MLLSIGFSVQAQSPPFTLLQGVATTGQYSYLDVEGFPCASNEVTVLVNGNPTPYIVVQDFLSCQRHITVVMDATLLHPGDALQLRADCNGQTSNTVKATLSEFTMEGPLFANSVNIFAAHRDCDVSNITLVVDGVTAPASAFQVFFDSFGLVQATIPFGYLKPGQKVHLHENCYGGINSNEVTVQPVPAYISVTGSASNGVSPTEQGDAAAAMTTPVVLNSCGALNIASHGGFNAKMTISEYDQQIGVFKLNGTPISNGDITFTAGKQSYDQQPIFTGTYTQNRYYGSTAINQPFFNATTLSYEHNGVAACNDISMFFGPIGVAQISTSGGVTGFGLITDGNYNHKTPQTVANPNAKFELVFDGTLYKVLVDGNVLATVNRTVQYSSSFGTISNTGVLPYGTGVTFSPGTSTGDGYIEVLIDGYLRQRQAVHIDAATTGTLTLSPAPSSVCAGTPSTITATGCTGTLTWSTGETGSSISVSPTTTTTYSATCAGTCSTLTGSTQVTVNPAPVAPSLSANPSTICQGTQTTITATGCSGTVNWSTGQTGNSIQVGPWSKTTYSATCTELKCTGPPASIDINVNAFPGNPTVTATPSSICVGATTTLEASGCATGSTYTWNDGITGDTRTITGRTPGTLNYSVVCSLNNCGSDVPGTASVTVTSIPVAPTAPSDLTVKQNSASQTVYFTGCAGTINWSGSNSTSGTGSIALPTTTIGSFTYTASCSVNGCVSPTASFVYSVYTPDPCDGQSTTADWQNTGNTRCNGNAREAEQSDNNSCSPTKGQTRWVVTDPNGCAPVIAKPDVVTTPPSTPVTIPVLTNDQCKDGSTATLTCVNLPVVTTAPSCGTTVTNADGTITFTPAVDCPRSVTFAYQICENGNGANCATTTVTVNIPQPCDKQSTTADWQNTGNTRCNGNAREAEQSDNNSCSPTKGQTQWVVTDPTGCAPIKATPDEVTTIPGTPVTIRVLTNDRCKDGSTATLTCVSLPVVTTAPTCGTASVNADGTITFSAAPDCPRSVTFAYQICENGNGANCATTTVTVTIPQPCDGQSTTASWTNTGNTRCNGNVREAEQVDANPCSPTQGQIQWVVTDPTGCAPVVGIPDVVTTPPTTPVTIPVLTNDKCKDGIAASLTCVNLPVITTDPTCGTAHVNTDGTITFTPGPDCPRSVTFVYQICEVGNGANCASTTVTVNIPRPCDGQVTSVDWQNTGNTRCNGIAREAEQQDGNNCSPTAGQTRWVVTDPFGCAPIIATPDGVRTTPSTPVTIPVLTNDQCKDGSGATLTCVNLPVVTTAPACGTTVTNTDGTITFTPAQDCPRSVTFAYQICENGNGANCATTVVTITIPQPCDGQSTVANWTNTGNTRCNGNAREAEQVDANPCSPTKGQTQWVVTDPTGCAPIKATPDEVTTIPGTPVTIRVLTNDRCKDGSTATLTCVSLPVVTTAPTCGTASVNADGTITFSAAPDCPRSVTFAYQICENGNGANCASTVVTITLKPLCDAFVPIPSLSATPASICSGGQSTLTASGCPGTVNWSTGQSGSSIVVTPTVNTTYTASCNVTGLCESPAGRVEVTIGGLPAAPSITASNATICVGNQTTLIAQNCAGTVNWSNGQTGNTIVVSPNTTTTYHASCNTGNFCESAATEISVTVLPVPDPVRLIFIQEDMVRGVNTTVCAGEVLKVVAQGCEGGQIIWSDGSMGQFLLVTAANSTRYTAVCQRTCQSAPSNVATLTVNPIPVAPTLSASQSAICVGSPASLSASFAAGSVKWSTGDTTSVITVSPVETTRYTATVYANGCSSAPSELTLVVNQLPASPAIGFASSSTLSSTSTCAGISTTLVASASCDGQISWSNGAMGSSITVTPMVSTTYSAVCVSLAGCSSPVSNTLAVEVGVIPGTPSIVSTGLGLCDGDTIRLQVANLPAKYKALWSDGSQNEMLTITQAGAYAVAFQDANGCLSAASDTARVTVFKRPLKPVLTLATAMDVVVTDDSIPSPYIYRWFLDDNRVRGAAGLQFRPDANGKVTAERRVEYYLAIPHTDPVRYDTLVCPVRASINVKADGELILFPNPTEGPVTIETRGTLKLTALKVRLFDELGREIFNGYTSVLENGKMTVDLSYLPDAVYILQVNSDTFRESWKVIKLSKK